MKILVTGGAGYVGSHAAKLLRQAGHDVHIYDSLVYGHRGAALSCELIEGDLMDREKLESVLRSREIDAVMHFAAFAFVGESVTAPHKYYQNNIVGSLSLLEAMRAADVQRIVSPAQRQPMASPRRFRSRKPSDRTRSILMALASWSSNTHLPTMLMRTAGDTLRCGTLTPPVLRRMETSAKTILPKHT